MDFQTRKEVAEYMTSLIPFNAGTILEPTPGLGQLAEAAKSRGTVIAPERFEDLPIGLKTDWAIMNPPFTPISEAFRFLSEVMKITDNIVALVPWLTIINSDKRSKFLKEYGLRSVTHLPRKAFPGARVQCCVLNLQKGYSGITEFKVLTF